MSDELFGVEMGRSEPSGHHLIRRRILEDLLDNLDELDLCLIRVVSEIDCSRLLDEAQEIRCLFFNVLRLQQAVANTHTVAGDSPAEHEATLDLVNAVWITRHMVSNLLAIRELGGSAGQRRDAITGLQNCFVCLRKSVIRAQRCAEIVRGVA